MYRNIYSLRKNTLHPSILISATIQQLNECIVRSVKSDSRQSVSLSVRQSISPSVTGHPKEWKEQTAAREMIAR